MQQIQGTLTPKAPFDFDKSLEFMDLDLLYVGILCLHSSVKATQVFTVQRPMDEHSLC